MNSMDEEYFSNFNNERYFRLLLRMSKEERRKYADMHRSVLGTAKYLNSSLYRALMRVERFEAIKKWGENLPEKKERKSVVSDNTYDEEKVEDLCENNTCSLGIEMGLNTDENIVSTIMGFAVKSHDGYKLYDKDKHQIINVGEIESSSFESFILPVTSVKEGDLIKNSDEYYYVMTAENNVVKTLSAKTGEIKEIIPTMSILGFYSYSKVVSIMDYMKAEDDASIQKIALISSLCSVSSSNNINQLIPLLLLNDSIDKNDIIIMLLMKIASMI